MDRLMNVFTASKDSKTLNRYLDCSDGNYCFEVKDGDLLLYRGDSFEKAQEAYENLILEAPL
jgi:hypothetical protein